jgi:hypothetical protein
MSQVHLYGIGPGLQLNAPTEWETTGVDSTINDSVVESSMSSTEFTFEGKAGEFVLNWMNTNGKGSFNGIPYKVIYESNVVPGDSSVRFTGYIDVFNAEILSAEKPVRIKAPVVATDDNKTVIDQMAVITQGLLIKNGYLTASHYVDCPVIRESKKNISERIMIIEAYGSKVVMGLMQIVSNMLSALSDVLGLSVLIGVVELLVAFVNGAIVIKKLVDEGIKLRDIFWPQIAYYKVASFKTILTQAFAYKGYPVDFGILDNILGSSYIMASQNEFDGYQIQGFPATGALKREDKGYIIGEILEEIEQMFNMRFRVKDGVAHLKTKKDPYWFTTSSYAWDNTLIKTAGQHQNGTTKYDTDSVKATVMFNYAYDASDAHTLTAKNGDSHEVHRKLIIELDPKLNAMKGIQEWNSAWAMAVRKQPFDNLWDLFTGVSAEVDNYVVYVQDKITEFLGQLNSSGVAIGTSIIDILANTGIGSVFVNRAGCLKIDDNSFALPKVIYLKDTSMGKRIPANFKDFIGARALYENWHKWESPADVSAFRGQYRLYNDVFKQWSYKKFTQVQNNPYFSLDGAAAKFTFVNWVEATHSAVADIQQQKPFDQNITEEEI